MFFCARNWIVSIQNVSYFLAFQLQILSYEYIYSFILFK